MKLNKLLLGIALSTLSLSNAYALEGTLKKIDETGTIRLGHRESSVPFSYYDQNQQVIGYSQDIALKVVDAVSAKLGKEINVQLNPITSQNRIPLMTNGTIDFECGSTTNNLERQKQVAFSNSIFVVGIKLMTDQDSGIKDFPDLSGKNVVTTAGTTSERILKEMNSSENLGMKLISAKDHGEAFLTLQGGRAAAFVMDDALLYGERAKAKEPSRWVVTGTPQGQEAYGCMLRKGDSEFKALADETIAGLMKSGEIEEIYKKWFTQAIPPKNVNLDFTLSAEMQALFSEPNDKAFQ